MVSDDVGAVLRAEEARLERELETLAAVFDRWWFAVPDQRGALDLREGARLHEEIMVRLSRLAAIRTVRSDVSNTVQDTPSVEDLAPPR
jgi:hypothetical protein